MLIISYVEICSKPMAILLYDDFFCACVFSPCLYLACHSGFLEGYYFSMMIFVCLCEKLRSLLYLAGWADPQDVKGNVERKVERGRVEELLERWRKKVGMADWGRRLREVARYSLENLNQSSRFSHDVLQQARPSWSPGH